MLRKILNTVKGMALPISIISGVCAYFIYHNLPLGADVRHTTAYMVGVVQPLLLFFMLFLSFCRVEPQQMKPKLWHIWLGLLQIISCAIFALIAMYCSGDEKIIAEVAMCCLVCPPATASVVIIGKLGGNISSGSTYIVIGNIIVSIVMPLFIPFIHPESGATFLSTFWTMIGKLFPLMLGPLLLAWLVRYMLPKVHAYLVSVANLSFFLWLIALSLAMATACRALVNSNVGHFTLAAMAVVSLGCCLFQFWVGRRIGAEYSDSIAAGQTLGQKNTVFLIWMAYTFLTPVTAISGGLYSIWHNLINTWQLARHERYTGDPFKRP